MDRAINSPFSLKISSLAKEQIEKIMQDRSSKGLQKQLKKSFKHLQNDPKHPGLNSHLLSEVDGVKVWTSYVQNNTPRAYRILWSYGDQGKVIAHY